MELAVIPEQHVKIGQTALRELKALVQRRQDKLVINGKQYLYFTDYQMLVAFFGITAWVVETREITQTKRIDDFNFLEVIGFHCRAVARKDGQEISAAEAECMFNELNLQKKPRFQVLSMAQTRACAKVLRNCLSWIVKLPDPESKEAIFHEEAVEERQVELE